LWLTIDLKQSLVIPMLRVKGACSVIFIESCYAMARSL
jgi:hypothetical protein